MSKFLESKRILVLLLGFAATAAWTGVWYAPKFDAKWAGILCATYIAGQSIVDFAKAWKAK